ncbi:MAG: patatin-like phospholipase family protein [Acidimicrobiales bacterium]
MDLAESVCYLRHHLEIAGRADPLIADDAAARLHRYANELPRALNNAATAALMAAAPDGKALVDDSCAKKAIAELTRTCLVDAVTASTAAPGLVPTVSINGSRYIDGGVRSTENADLALGYANVVVLAPLGGRSGELPEGQFEGLRRSPEWGTDVESQVEALRTRGSHVAVITPDVDSRAAMGTNQMDLATRIPSARAGFAQGKQEATRVTFS